MRFSSSRRVKRPRITLLGDSAEAAGSMENAVPNLDTLNADSTAAHVGSQPAGQSAAVTSDIAASRALRPPPNLYLNRELGQLAFTRRVLAQAADRATPLLERLKFLCIVSSNLDEFFEIR